MVNGGTALTYTYTYDQNYNITKISYSTGKEIRYVYDNLGQLIREDNGPKNETYLYTYDLAGNITSKSTYLFTAASTTPSSPKATNTYTYGDSSWGDRLTSYNGQNITYDNIGNPLTYYNGSSYTFVWNGRQLAGATKDGVTYSFTYNDGGIRTGKTASNGKSTRYLLDGSKIIAEITDTETILYIYDEVGTPIGMQYRLNTYANGVWDTFWFEKNLHGDIVAVYNTSGVKCIGYVYNAWGKVVKNTYNAGGTNANASKNPFLYRGYYYDNDLKLYYLNSRYYDCNLGRFITPDKTDVVNASPTALTDKNLYSYCDNNPVTRADGDGEFWETVFDVISLGTSIVEVFVNPADPWAWAGLVGDAIDLVPFVTGVGEVTRAVKITSKAVDSIDNVIDTAKAVHRSADVASDIRRANGSYEILYESGKNYAEKGGFSRAITSAQQHSIDNNRNVVDRVISISWKSAPDPRSAFIDEYMLQLKRGVGNPNTYNKIWSPGRKYLR